MVRFVLPAEPGQRVGEWRRVRAGLAEDAAQPEDPGAGAVGRQRPDRLVVRAGPEGQLLGGQVAHGVDQPRPVLRAVGVERSDGGLASPSWGLARLLLRCCRGTPANDIVTSFAGARLVDRQAQDRSPEASIRASRCAVTRSTTSWTGYGARMSHDETGGTRPRYCVIGAGAAGLAAVRALIAAGHDFDCFEATDRVGGHWHTDYDALHLITPRDGSGFSGDPMPGDWAHFPRRAQMVEYLEGHADRFDLRSRVTFGTRVERLEPVGPNGREGWDVTTSDGADEAVRRRPRRQRPQLGAVHPGHARDVQRQDAALGRRTTNPSDIEGKRVLVVGSGNSGCDIASELGAGRLRHRPERSPRAPLPAEDVLRQAARDAPDHEAAAPAARSGPSLPDLAVGRSPGGLRPAEARRQEPQRPAAGREQPRAALDPARPRRPGTRDPPVRGQ